MLRRDVAELFREVRTFVATVNEDENAMEQDTGFDFGVAQLAENEHTFSNDIYEPGFDFCGPWELVDSPGY
eukprot:2431665-Amphidinium_carterae.1